MDSSPVLSSPDNDPVATMVKGDPPPFSTDPEKIMKLLQSRQFEVIYSSHYQGTDQEVVDLMRRCEMLCGNIATSESRQGLVNGLAIADACLVPLLPGSEVRNLVRTIVDRDVTLINEMPEVRRILWRVFKAIEFSVLLDERVLRRVNADLARFRR